ncbi:MAG TPA: NAD(+) synthase [Nannocystis exedens]|nr:NAD(+) synthase [Nannocystis exedens]
MTAVSLPFSSIYRHGFARVAVCVPELRVADPAFNSERTIALMRRASAQGAAVVVFPELGLSAYSCDDLFHQEALLDASLSGLLEVLRASRELTPLVFVGLPLRVEGHLFNCAVALCRGVLLGVVPKSYLPNYREFYEGRYFAATREALAREVTIEGMTIPFGDDLIFSAKSLPKLRIHAEICEDVWVPIPPSTYAALAGATVLCNLSASNITIGKADYRRNLCAAHSGRCVAAYLYTAAGSGESTTDLAWDGHGMIYENGALLAESLRFCRDEQVIFADVDLERLSQERLRLTSFGDAVADLRERLRGLRRIDFDLDLQVLAGAVGLERRVDRYPFVPSDDGRRDERCYEAYNIQVHGLCKRMRAAHIDKIVLGVSGGLDSTQALLVAAKAMDRLGLPRSHVLAYTMPGFATSSRTYDNAWSLMRALGATASEIDIKPACLQMMADIGHPYHAGEELYDITFENVQAGERTSHLFRLANHHNGMVLGTGDLSELALGWSTYGVGDHMSHYTVNASVPKTLIQFLIRWVIDAGEVDRATAEVLQSIVDTEISPELIPAGAEGTDVPAQSTESSIGPYDLQDFNIYYITRFGFRPSKVAFLAQHAWSDRSRGEWPRGMPAKAEREYDLATIKRWLAVFLHRFFQISQFKRSCVPNGPKVGSGGSLSPRGDWRAPSDSEATAWLAELQNDVPDLPD